MDATTERVVQLRERFFVCVFVCYCWWLVGCLGDMLSVPNAVLLSMPHRSCFCVCVCVDFIITATLCFRWMSEPFYVSISNVCCAVHCCAAKQSLLLESEYVCVLLQCSITLHTQREIGTLENIITRVISKRNLYLSIPNMTSFCRYYNTIDAVWMIDSWAMMLSF